jgi:hypothetical protein
MGTTSAALLVFSASSSWLLSMLGPSAELSVARTLMDLTFITGAAPAIGTLGLALWTVSRTVLSSRALPFGRYVGFAWFTAVSLMVWRRESRTDLPETGDNVGL